MSVLARVILALIVGPGVGAIVGQDLAGALAARAGLEAGVVARAEMNGLLVGGLAGVVFMVLAIRCTVGFEGRLRGRIADAALLPVAALAALTLLARQRHAPAELVAVIRWTMVGVWVPALVLLLVSLRYRPPAAVPEAAPAPQPEPVPAGAPPEASESEWDRYVSEAYDDE